MNRVRRTLALMTTAALVMTVSPIPLAAADPPPGMPSSDYDLSTLTVKQAVYNPTSGTIVTVDKKAKVLVPAMDAAGPAGRYLEVRVKAEAAGINVLATWWEGTEFHRSNLEPVAGGTIENVLLDLSSMGETTGPVKIRFDGTTSGGSSIRRITLFEEAETGPPNIVLILVDDMRADEMDLGFNRSLPAASSLETELIDKGTTFRNFFNTTPLCCPSRASYLTGQYAHNHHVYANNGTQVPGDNGGILRFFLDDRDETSLGTWMQDAGYETVLVGKYLNGYPDRQGLKAMGVTESYVPAGWDEWYATFLHDNINFAPLTFSYDNFRMNENGTVAKYGPGAYLTDVETDKAVDFINRRAGEAPFFMMLNAYAPHGPTSPKPVYDGDHSGVTPPAPPSCNEEDLTDKPQWVQDIDQTVEFGDCWGAGWQRRLDMTLSLDDMIAAVVAELEEEGVIDNTYIFFTSDNGLMRGEHKLSGKSVPYEESIRVPLVVRGPNVAAGLTRPHLTLNIDLAPTFLELAGGSVTPGSPPIDGESLVDPMMGTLSASSWRDAVLIELRTEGASPNQPFTVPKYFGVRTPDQLWMEYEGGDKEHYDLATDPYQLTSIHDSSPPAVRDELKAFLRALDDCVGAECAVAARDPVVTGLTHVDAIEITARVAKSRAIVKVTILDEEGAKIEDAVVNGDWTVDSSLVGSFAEVTNAVGKAKFSFLLSSPTTGLGMEFCVTDVMHAALGYDPGANVETCETFTWP